MNCTLLRVTSGIYMQKRASFDVFFWGIPDGAGVFRRTSTSLAQTSSAAEACRVPVTLVFSPTVSRIKQSIHLDPTGLTEGTQHTALP